MTTSEGSAERTPERFVGRDLRGARFVASDLSGVVMRAVDVQGLEVDAPWLLEGGGELVVNGVDVVPFVDAELERRFPGRGTRTASDPDGLRAAWEVLQGTWAAVLERVATMPAGTVDVSVDGEWTFAQTLRHLVMATDTWLGRGIEEVEEPYHPIGVPNAEYETDGYDLGVFSAENPSYEDVLAVRAGHVERVRAFLAATTPEQLAEPRRNPWAPEHPETVLACLHTVLGEEWEHLRYAVRDLDAIAARAGG